MNAIILFLCLFVFVFVFAFVLVFVFAFVFVFLQWPMQHYDESVQLIHASPSCPILTSTLILSDTFCSNPQPTDTFLIISFWIRLDRNSLPSSWLGWLYQSNLKHADHLPLSVSGSQARFDSTPIYRACELFPQWLKDLKHASRILWGWYDIHDMM